jgi:hypothetical protein
MKNLQKSHPNLELEKKQPKILQKSVQGLSASNNYQKILELILNFNTSMLASDGELP